MSDMRNKNKKVIVVSFYSRIHIFESEGSKEREGFSVLSDSSDGSCQTSLLDGHCDYLLLSYLII